MKFWQLFLLLGAIYVAPNLSAKARTLLAGAFVLLTVLSYSFTRNL
jgi:hypothetical protein